MFILLLGIAFLAGAITAISPCALPVLPIVFAGGAAGGRRRPLAIVAGVVVGFTISLLALSWILDRLGLPQDVLRKIAIVLLFVVAATARVRVSDLGGGFVLGLALGVVFTPCAGTVLTAVSAQTATVHGLRRFGVAVAYALGVAVLMLAVAYGANHAAGLRRRA